jgi:hypothetical protein
MEHCDISMGSWRCSGRIIGLINKLFVTFTFFTYFYFEGNTYVVDQDFRACSFGWLKIQLVSGGCVINIEMWLEIKVTVIYEMNSNCSLVSLLSYLANPKTLHWRQWLQRCPEYGTKKESGKIRKRPLSVWCRWGKYM